MEGLTVNVSRWSGWGVREQVHYWRQNVAGLTVVHPDQPDLSWVPALKRRRLSALARCAFQVLGDCTDRGEQHPVIFSSSMGELSRTQSILEAIAVDEAVSPTAFSLSVHNAAGGMWSLLQDLRAPVVALAPVAQSPVPGLLEALGMLAEGSAETVTLVYFEAPFPDFYDPFMQGPEQPFAVALRLVGANSHERSLCRIRLSACERQERCSETDNRQALLSLLLSEQSLVRIVEPQATWQLERLA